MKKNGLWINEHQFIGFAEGKAQKPLTEEIVTRQRSLNFYTLANIYLPNPDPVLLKEGRTVAVYRDLLVDDRVAGNLSNRKGAVLSLEWEIDRGARGKVKSRQARVIEEWVESLDIQRVMSEILDALWYGYQPLEVLWETRGGLYLPRDIQGKPPEWFIYNTDNELRFRSRANPLYGEELPPRSFVVPRHNASYYFPYGLGDAASCFWPVVFKKGGWRFWVSFAEKYGQAFAVGKIRRGASPAEMSDLADKLESMVQDAIAVIYDDSSVELMSDQGKGASSDLFRALINEANTAISTVIMGHAGGGEAQSGDKFSKDSVGLEVRKDIVAAGKKLICQTLNQVIRWIGEVNWGTAEVPTFSLFEEEEVDGALAERDEKLSGALEKSGLKLSKGYFVRSYNLEETDIEEKPPAQPPTASTSSTPSTTPPVQFAEETPDRADELAGEAGELALPLMDGLVAPLRRLAMEAKSLEEIRDGLLDLYGEMDPAALGTLMQQVMTAADLSGRAEVLDGD